MTQAIVLHESGGPEKLRWESVEVGEPGEGELRIRHTAIGVNFHDTYVRSGSYRTLPEMIECHVRTTSHGQRKARSNDLKAQEDFVDLSLSTRSEGDRTVVEVGGEIDVYTAPRLREQLVDLVADGKYHLIVDMERVDFLDSTGLGVLVGGLKRVRAHDGSLRLVCTQERILKIFRITGLTKVFPIHSSIDEAVNATD